MYRTIGNTVWPLTLSGGGGVTGISQSLESSEGQAGLPLAQVPGVKSGSGCSFLVPGLGVKSETGCFLPPPVLLPCSINVCSPNLAEKWEVYSSH